MKRISIEASDRIKSLLSEGFSYSEVALKVMVSKTTVSRIAKENSLNDANKHTGRPAAITTRHKRSLSFNFKHGRLITLKDGVQMINNACNKTVSKVTIMKYLRASGLQSRVRPLKPRLLSAHKKNRLNFASIFLSAPDSFWDTVIFTDESKINMYGPDGYRKVWRLPGPPSDNHHFRQTVKFGGGSVMVWGAITSHGVGELLFIDGRMNAEMFLNILKLGLKRTAEMHGLNWSNLVFQQDNDPKHTAKLTQRWINDHISSVLSWPSCSPDLNPIEHVWNDVKSRIYTHPKAQNLDELRALIKNEWYKTDPQYIKNLYRSMNRRIKAIIDAKGGHTKY